ncbi:hypothetical protein [Agromyces rhizosphaerae]|nr:hypothetical protein [Agromyces rhizosphaerae]
MAEPVYRITTMGSDAPSLPHPQPHEPTQSATFRPAGHDDPGDAGGTHEEPPRDAADEPSPMLLRTIDRVLAVQRPIVLAHLRGIRRRSPHASPDQLVRILERRYLAAITTGGAAVGATAVIPAISTPVTLALSGVETAGFLEATALFAQSVAEVHGIAVDNPDRARALVMTLMLGREGSDLIRQFAGQATGSGVDRNAYWGELITNSLPKAVMSTVVDRLRHTFIKQFAARGGASVIGKAIPFGIGAVIGGAGNHVLGRRVLQQSRLAFGPPPALVPSVIEPTIREAQVTDASGGRLRRIGSAAAGGVTRAARSAGRIVPGRRRREAGDDIAEASSPVE